MPIVLDYAPEIERSLREQVPELDAETRIEVAVQWFRAEKISLSQLAKIMNLTRHEADVYLARRGIYEQTPTLEELEQDYQTGKAFLARHSM